MKNNLFYQVIEVLGRLALIWLLTTVLPPSGMIDFSHLIPRLIIIILVIVWIFWPLMGEKNE